MTKKETKPEPQATPPVEIGKTKKIVSLDGKLFAWAQEQPVFWNMPASPHVYLACFTDVESLRAMHEKAGAPFEKIKQIDNGNEFLSSFDENSNVVVILDPYFTPEGRVRFTQICRIEDGEPLP